MDLLDRFAMREMGFSRKFTCLNRAIEDAAENAMVDSSFQHQLCKFPEDTKTTNLLALSPNGKLLASCHSNKRVHVVDVNTGQVLHSLQGHSNNVWALAFHPVRNDLLASGCLAGEVRVWDLNTGCCEILQCSGAPGAVASVAFHPDGRLLVIATTNRLIFWDWNANEPWANIETSISRERIRYVKFDRTGQILYTAITNTSGSRRITTAASLIPTTVMPSDYRELVYSRQELIGLRSNLARRHEHLVERYNSLLRRYHELRARYPDYQGPDDSSLAEPLPDPFVPPTRPPRFPQEEADRQRESPETPPSTPITSRDSSRRNSVVHQADAEDAHQIEVLQNQAIDEGEVSVGATSTPIQRQWVETPLRLNPIVVIENFETGVRSSPPRLVREEPFESVTPPPLIDESERNVPPMSPIQLERLNDAVTYAHDLSQRTLSQFLDRHRSSIVRLERSYRRLEEQAFTLEQNFQRVYREIQRFQEFQRHTASNAESFNSEGHSWAGGLLRSLSAMQRIITRDNISIRDLQTAPMVRETGVLIEALSAVVDPSGETPNTDIPQDVLAELVRIREFFRYVDQRLEVIRSRENDSNGSESSEGRPVSPLLLEVQEDLVTGIRRVQDLIRTWKTTVVRSIEESSSRDFPPTLNPNEPSTSTASSSESRTEVKKEAVSETPKKVGFVPLTLPPLSSKISQDESPGSSTASANITVSPLKLGKRKQQANEKPLIEPTVGEATASTPVKINLSPSRTERSSSGSGTIYRYRSPFGEASSRQIDDDQPGPSGVSTKKTKLECTFHSEPPRPSNDEATGHSACGTDTAAQSATSSFSRPSMMSPPDTTKMPTRRSNPMHHLAAAANPFVTARQMETEGRGGTLARDLARATQNVVEETGGGRNANTPLISFDSNDFSARLRRRFQNVGIYRGDSSGDGRSWIQPWVPSSFVRQSSPFAADSPRSIDREGERPQRMSLTESAGSWRPIRRELTRSLRGSPFYRRTDTTAESTEESASGSRTPAARSLLQSPVYHQRSRLERRSPYSRNEEPSTSRPRTETQQWSSNGDEWEFSPQTSSVRAASVQAAAEARIARRGSVANFVARLNLNAAAAALDNTPPPAQRQQLPERRVVNNEVYVRLRPPAGRTGPSQRGRYYVRVAGVAPEGENNGNNEGNAGGQGPNPLDDVAEDDQDYAQDLNHAINRAIAGAFIGTGDTAIATNILDLTCRIQEWDFSKKVLPAISNGKHNVIAEYAKVHNDGSVSFSQNGQLMACFTDNLQNENPIWTDTVLQIISLRSYDKGTVLFKKLFGPNAVSLSISPCDSHIMIGLATRRYLRLRHSPETFAQIYHLSSYESPEDKNHELNLVLNLDRVIPEPINPDDVAQLFAARNCTLNCSLWLRFPGEGFAYGTNKGQLCLIKPLAGSDRRDREKGAPPAFVSGRRTRTMMM